MIRAAGAGLAVSLLVAGCGGGPLASAVGTPSPGASAVSPSATLVPASPSSGVASVEPVVSARPLASGPPAAVGSIAYVVGTMPDDEVRIVAADGTGDRACGAGSSPSWSADGGTVVLARPGGHDADGLEVSDVVRAGPDCATTVSVIANGNDPHLSPDGTWVTFGRGVVDTGGAWLAAVDGTGARELMAGTSPTWSPDGTWLLFNPDTGAYELGLIRPDGSGYRSLGLGADAAWTPDGRVISRRVDASGTTTVQVVAPDGTADVLLATPNEIRQPRMAVDGRVVFVADGDVWRLDPGATRPVRLTQGLQVAAGPSLSTDGRWAAVGAAATPGLVIVSLDGGSLPIVAGPVTDVAWQPVAAGR